MLSGLATALALPPTRVFALVVGYLLAGLFGAGLATYAFRRRRAEPSVRAFGYLALVATLVCLALSARMLSTTLETKLLWNTVTYVGWGAIGPLILLFVLRYVDAGSDVSRRTLAGLAVVPAVTLVLVATTQFHSIHYADVGLRYVDGWPIARLEVGTWFWVFWIYEYGLCVLGAGVLLHYARDAAGAFRTQAVALVVALLLMLSANLAFLVFGLAPFPGADLTPFGIAAGLLVVGAAVFHVGFIDVVPVARERVFEALDDPVVVVNRNGIVVDANAAADCLLDASQPLAPARDVLPPEVLDSGLLEDDVEESEVELAGDTDTWYLVRRHPVGEGAFALIFTDVTERRVREQRLEEFASVLSHDVRNPLAVADGHLALARDSDDPGPHIEATQRAVDRIGRIVDDLLTVAEDGGSVTDPEPIDLATVAEAAWSSVDTGDAQLSVVDTMVIEADFDRLQRALENLFRNSVDHGATVHRPSTQPTRNGDPVTVTVGTTPDGFYVADDGPGIPEASRELVFDRGYTTGGDGVGLGLTIVAGVADAHGWSVEATEGEAGGARFVFRTQRSVVAQEQS
ncbi:sensor histidine kinase [Halorarius litoreus]|uniref:sensor histidine kinase n=1 Tax=Halorarius litoreus TaxID=2962676 RepID=UPI0020CFBAF4|nr:histidine kinase N-terminal 7TM domain-containing protein [Halorarius litoreus]